MRNGQYGHGKSMELIAWDGMGRNGTDGQDTSRDDDHEISLHSTLQIYNLSSTEAGIWRIPTATAFRFRIGLMLWGDLMDINTYKQSKHMCVTPLEGQRAGSSTRLRSTMGGKRRYGAGRRGSSVSRILRRETCRGEGVEHCSSKIRDYITELRICVWI